METYSQGAFTMTKLATKGCWALFEGVKQQTLFYEIVLVESGQTPYTKGWIKYGTKFNTLTEAVEKLKTINPLPIVTTNNRVQELL